MIEPLLLIFSPRPLKSGPLLGFVPEDLFMSVFVGSNRKQHLRMSVCCTVRLAILNRLLTLDRLLIRLDVEVDEQDQVTG